MEVLVKRSRVESNENVKVDNKMDNEMDNNVLKKSNISCNFDSKITFDCLDIIMSCIEKGLKAQGVDMYFMNTWKSQDSFSWIHNQKKTFYMTKKKWIEQFGGEISCTYPPWIPIQYNSKLYESILHTYENKLYTSVKQVCNTSLEILKLQNAKVNVQINENEKKEMENFELLICFQNPLPLLIFSPEYHSYTFDEKNTTVRLYTNILENRIKQTDLKKNITEKLKKRFVNIQELNSSISFICLKNTLRSNEIKNCNLEIPILYLKLSPIYISLLACTYLYGTFNKSGGLNSFPYSPIFDPEMLWGFLKGCRYAFLNKTGELNNTEEKEALLQVCLENEKRKQGFYQGKRKFLSLQEHFDFLIDVPDLKKKPTWKRLQMQKGDIISFPINSTLFMFAQGSKTKGECLIIQMIHELRKEEKKEKNICISLPFNNSTNTLYVNEWEAYRLEMYHKKNGKKEFIPSIQTFSCLDENQDDMLICPKLIQSIQGIQL